MKLKLLLILAHCWLLGTQMAHPSTFMGRVTNPALEPLVGATIKLELNDLVQTAAAAKDGRFHFSDLEAGSYRVTVSHLGYQSDTLTRKVAGQTEHHFILFPEAITLQEVRIEDLYQQQRKKEETVSIDVVGADYVRLHNTGSLMHTLRRLPGIQSVNVGSGQSKPLIRGLGFNRIVVAEHGIKHESQQWGADHALEVDQFAHDHIELIKGPGSLVYGSDALGGVVQLSNRNTSPPGTLSAHVNLLGRSSNQLLGTSVSVQGRKQQWSFSGRVTWQDYADSRVPIDSVDVYSYRVPLYKNRLRNTAGNELNYHLSLGFTDSHLNNRLFISYVQQEAGFFANAHGLEPRSVDTALYDQSDRDILYPRQQAQHFKVVNRTIVDWGKTTLIGETGYQHNLRKEYSQYVNHGYMPPAFPDSLDQPSDLEREFDKHTLSANIRIKNQLSAKHQLTMGLTTEYQDNNIGGVSFLMPAFRQWLAGGYVLHEWEASRLLHINTGIRYDHSFLSTVAYYDWFPTQGDYLQRAAELNREVGHISGIVGVNYHWENTILRANLGRSFRVPLAKELAANGVNYHRFSYEVGNESLKPETAWQLDLGAEYSSPAWNARISPFATYFPNYIYLNPTHKFDFDHGAGNQVYYYMDTEVFRWGGEVALLGHLAENFTIELSAEYTFSEQVSGEKKGFTIPFSPPASVLTGFSWQPWSNNSRESLQELTLMADARITAAQNRIVPPEKKTPGYQSFNMGLRGTLHVNETPVNWHFMVNNLFNNHYLVHTSYYRLIGVPEPGRNFTISLNVPLKLIET